MEDYKDFYNTEIPVNIQNRIRNSEVTVTEFKDKNEVLIRDELHKETGIAKCNDGSYLVSMYCEMPGVTPEMVRWWFWWHPQRNERYQAWFPGAHKRNSYARKNKSYFERTNLPEFEPNSQFPRETIGDITATLQIDFISPPEFGFTSDAMKKGNVAEIVCGHVGIKNVFWHTEMAHIWKYSDDGLFMYSRFWMGKLCRFSFLKRFIATEKNAKAMAEHCCIEYRNLARILPPLYEKYGKSNS